MFSENPIGINCPCSKTFVMPFANYDTDEIDSYMEITFPDYDNPVVILYDGNRQIRLYDGTEKNEFKAEDLVRIFENE